MAIHLGHGGMYSRQKQMRNELIGLVIGAAFLLTGTAFLFNHAVEGSSTIKQEQQPATIRTLAVQTTQRPAILDNAAPVASLATTLPPTETTMAAIPKAEATAVPAAATPETEATAVPAAATPEAVAAPATDNTGWIYAGQFVNNKWLEKGLTINDELPVVGQSYPLSWGAVVRAAPPGKNSGGKHSTNKGNLSAGQKVEVVQVKKSGNKGHIWLEIKQ
jgi:hypothetical protein